jgi:hypothetical protein
MPFFYYELFSITSHFTKLVKRVMKQRLQTETENKLFELSGNLLMDFFTHQSDCPSLMVFYRHLAEIVEKRLFYETQRNLFALVIAKEQTKEGPQTFLQPVTF